MTETTTTGKLAEALAKAQAKLSNVQRDRENPFFKSKYATLGAILEAVRGPLSENGIAVVQSPSTRLEDGTLFAAITTTLMHASGESVSSTLEAPVSKDDVQGVGSALTYLRRYSLQSMTGVAADEDDDGHAAARPDEPAPARSGRARVVEPPAAFPPFGRMKSQPIQGAPLNELEYYSEASRKTLADASKVRFHDKERALLAAYEEEIRRQKGGTAPEPKGDFYGQCIKLGAASQWVEADVGKWLKEKRGKTSKASVTADDVLALEAALSPPPPGDEDAPF